MQENTTINGTFCPSCFAAVPADAFFCPKCGKNLKTRPVSNSIFNQIVVYLVSILLPPFGLWYAWKYLKQPDPLSKRIGIAAVVLTVISIIVTVWITKAFINSINSSLNSSLNQFNF